MVNYDALLDEQVPKPPAAPPAEVPLGDAAGALSAPDKYEALADAEVKTRETALQSSMWTASQRQPERHAQVLRLAQKTQIPVPVVERNLDEVTKQDEVQGKDYAGIIQKTPGLAKWLEHPDNAAIGKDDLENLTKTEQAHQDQSFSHGLYESIVAGLGGMWGGLARSPGVVYNLFALPQNELVRQGVLPESFRTSAGKLPVSNGVAEYYEAGAATAKSQVPELDQSIVEAISAGDYAKAGKAFAMQTASNAPSQAALIAMAVMGYPGAGLTAMGFQEAGSTLKQGENQGMDPVPNTINALTHGMAEAAFENLGTLRNVRLWQGQIAKSFGKEAGKRVAREAAKAFVESTLTEGTEEFYTQAYQDLSDYMTGANPSLTFQESLNRSANAFILGAGTGGMMSAAGGAGAHAVHRLQARRMEQSLQAYDTIGKLVEQSKVQERAPEAHSQFLEHAAETSPLKNVYIQPERFEQYFQSKKVDPQSMAELLGISDAQFTEMKQTGRPLEIPYSKWLTSFGKTEHYQGLRNSVSFSESIPSQEDQKILEEQVKGKVDAELAQAQTPLPEADVKAEEQSQAIAAQIKAQLLQSGVKEAEAKRYAEVWASRYKTRAKRMGVEPQALFNQYGVEVRPADLQASTPEGKVFEQSATPQVPPFFSKLERTVEEKMGNSATVEQVHGMLREIKPEEQKWLGLNEFLAEHAGPEVNMQQKVSKQELLDHLRAHALQVQEITKVDPRFQSYVLPGGENYRGMLFTLPPRAKQSFQDYMLEKHGDKFLDMTDDQVKFYAEKYKNEQALEANAEAFRSSHFDEPDVLAHTRLTDRTDADGKRVLFVEEIQSDWHQAGRQKGYKGADTSAEVSRLKAEENVVLDDGSKSTDERLALAKEIQTQITSLTKAAREGVPDAPFKKTWHEFVLKRLIRMAAEQGYDRVAWTTGEQQAERYDLSKKVESIHFNKKDSGTTLSVMGQGEKLIVSRTDLSDDGIAELVGKEIAKQIRAAPTGYGKITGDNLKVGGEGMKGFYDKILVDAANKIGKKFGAKVGETKVETGNRETGGWSYVGPTKTPAELRALAKSAPNVSTQNQVVNLAYSLENIEWSNDPELFAEVARDNLSKASAQFIGGAIEESVGTRPIPVHSLEITPALRDEALNQGFSLFQPGEDGGSPRGRILLGDSKAIIELGKAKDRSTFLHESGHLWLNELGQDIAQLRSRDQATLTTEQQRLLEDGDTVLKWLGVESFDKIERGQHEKWANGMEAYLMEGKSPSIALKRAFARFKRWLLQVYKNVKALNVELTPEIRDVFDRLLASEEEITAARQEVGYTPIQETLKDQLSPDVLKRLETLQERAHDEAVSVLLSRQLDEIKAERLAFLDDRKKEFTATETARVQQEPIYRAQGDLKQGLKLKKPAKSIARDYLGGKLNAGRTATFDVIAEVHHFSSGSALAKAILATPSAAEAIQQRVSDAMSVYRDLKDAPSMRDEALKAVHTEQALELMDLEHEILISLIKKAEVSEPAKKRRAAEARLELAAIKARAREMTWKLNIKGATSYLPLFTAERRAAVSAEKAALKGDYEAAATLKRQQMLNHALAVESLRVSEQVEKWDAFLEGLRKKDMGSFKKEEHFVQIAEILAKLGIVRKDYDPKARKESLAEWAARIAEQTNVVNVPAWIFEETRIKPKAELAVHELKDVVNALKNIMRVASMEDRALTIADGAAFDQIKTDLRIAADLNRKGRKAKKLPLEPTKLDDAKSFGSKYLLSITKVQTILRSLDGWTDFGKWTKYIWEPVYQAANEESKLMQWASDGLKKSFELYSKKERSDILNRREYFPELGTSATKMKLLMMAMNLGNEDNRQKLTSNKPVGLDLSYEWNEQVVMGLLERHLTEKDWQFVQSIWNLINERWGDIASLHKELTGFAPDKVAAVPFNVTLPGGKILTLQGGYFPLKEDTRASVKASTRADLDSPLHTEGNPGWMAVTKTGHTKARTGAQYSVALDHTLIYRHLRDVIHDLAFRKVVIDLRHLTSDKEMHAILKEHVGLEGFSMLRDWVASVAAGNTQTLSPLERVVEWMRHRTVVAALVFRVGVIMQNFANVFAYGGAMDDFGHGDALRAFFVRGVGDYWRKALTSRKGYKETRQFVFERSRFMKDKHDSPDMSLHDAHAKAFGTDSKIQEFGKGLMAGSDELTSIPIWIEAYSQALEKHLGDQKAAILYADTLIDRVLGSGRKYDAAAVQRSGVMTKTLTMFYSFLNTEYNRWAAEAGKVQVDQKHLPAFLGFVFSRLVMFNVASLLLSGKGPGGDDEDKKVQWWLRQTLSYPLSLFPGVREISAVALDEILGLHSFGYRPSPAADAVDAMILKPIKTGAKYARGEGEGQDVLEMLSKSASYVVPYPDQFNAWFWNAHDAVFGDLKPQASDLYRRRPKSER